MVARCGERTEKKMLLGEKRRRRKGMKKDFELANGRIKKKGKTIQDGSGTFLPFGNGR